VLGEHTTTGGFLTMDAHTWQMVKEWLADAANLPEAERAAFIAQRCPDDALRREVLIMLGSDTALSGRLIATLPHGTRLGPYVVDTVLGAGGMGVVYAARDERLNRAVALKVIRTAAADERARERLRREARAAASLNHPNVCQLYDIGEENGELFLAMELLVGESLATKLARASLPCAQAIQVALSVLAALEALHRRGLVHRDLKPSNVFLASQGVKVLDFGLARSIKTEGSATETALTIEGAVVGTPAYMAPEQVLGRTVDGRTDLFAVACVLYEMLSGRTPFAGDSVVEVLHAVTSKEAPVLGGSPAVAAVDRVIHRALSKDPQHRYQTADAMAQDLRAVLLLSDAGVVTTARPMTRLIVLPFRMLRADEETNFLAFSLPDAITSSLTGSQTLIVRSSVVASRFGSEVLDLRAVAADADVDIVLTGTLVRVGEQLRVNTQLMEAPGGALLWSHAEQVSLGDLFTLQDHLASRIVSALSLPLAPRDHRMLKRDVPATAKAYEFYLRANQLADNVGGPNGWSLARDLYLQCLQEDPQYAPAWARLGRLHRMLAYHADQNSDEGLKRAEAAFVRALEINPDLSVAHNQFARLEIDFGRGRDAMIRLIERLKTQTADAELLSGLVQACRYCGLLDASRAADEQARRLDKLVRTSVCHTHFMLGDLARARATSENSYLTALIMVMVGEDREAIRELKRTEEMLPPVPIRKWWESLRLLLQGNRIEGLAATNEILRPGYHDAEALYYVARQLAYFGDPRAALPLLARAVTEGFFCPAGLAHDPWLESIRADPAFAEIVGQAEARHHEALEAFREATGDRLLGLTIAAGA
jgi:serine/threonine-protein kinase